MTAFNIGGREGFDFTKSYTVSTTTPEYPGTPLAVGTVAQGSDGSVWVFVQANGTIAAGDLVIVTDPSTGNWKASDLSNTNGRALNMLVGVAGAAAVAGQYLWLQREGYSPSVNVATGVAANAVLHTTTTAGQAGGTATGGSTASLGGIATLAVAASNKAAAVLNGAFVAALD